MAYSFGMGTLVLAKTVIVAAIDVKKTELVSKRTDLSAEEKADQISAIRITAFAHLLDNAVSVGEKPIKRKYGEENWENTKILTTLGVGIAEFNEAMRCAPSERKDEVFLFCTQNLFRYTCECIERKRERYKKDPTHKETYEVLTKLKHDFVLFDKAICLTQKMKDKEHSASTVAYLQDICSYLEASSQLNKELLEVQPVLDVERHTFEDRKQKIAVVSSALLQASELIAEMKQEDLSWEALADKGLGVLDVLAGCTHSLSEIEMLSPTVQPEQKKWWTSIQVYAEYSSKTIGCIRDAILLKSLWQKTNILAPTEEHITDAERRIEMRAVDVNALYSHEIPQEFHGDATLRLYCCPLTNTPIRHIAVVAGTGVFYEREAILQKIREEEQPESWPPLIPFNEHSLVDNFVVQNQINQRLAELFRERVRNHYLSLAGNR